MAHRFILTAVKDRVLHLTLNRPEQRNVLSQALKDEMFAALREAADDSSVGAIVIAGAGPSFCAGDDMTPTPGILPSHEMPIRDDIKRAEQMTSYWRVLWDFPKPTIAQVHGHCIAAGTDLALHCDMIIAAADARFGFPPVRVNGSPATHMWTYMVGPQWTKRILFTGDLVDGKTAAQIGLVLKAVPMGALAAEAHALAQRIALVPDDLLAAHKSICNKAIELMGRTVMQEIAIQTNVIAHKARSSAQFSRIASEQGLKAALEYRDARFREVPGGL